MDSLQTKIKEVLPKEKEINNNDSQTDNEVLYNNWLYDRGFNQALLDVHSSIPKIIEIIVGVIEKIPDSTRYEVDNEDVICRADVINIINNLKS